MTVYVLSSFTSSFLKIFFEEGEDGDSAPHLATAAEPKLPWRSTSGLQSNLLRDASRATLGRLRLQLGAHAL